MCSVLVVGTGEDAEFHTLTEAMEVAAAGDVIKLQPGLYEETLKVTQDVSVEALVPSNEEEDTETTIANGVIILANVTLRSIQIRGHVEIRKGHAIIEGCDIHHGKDGIRVNPKCKLSLKSSRIHHCFSSGDGIYFMPESSGEVDDSDIYECRVNGVHVDGSSVVLRNNRIRDAMYGIYYRRRSAGYIESNSLEHIKSFGIYVVEESDPVVRANMVRECGIQCMMVSQNGKGLWTDNSFEGSIHVLPGCEAKLGENRISGRSDIESFDVITVS